MVLELIILLELKKTKKVTTACRDNQNKVEEQSKKRDIIKQTVMKDYYKPRDDTERAECQGALTWQTT